MAPFPGPRQRSQCDRADALRASSEELAASDALPVEEEF
jgi:hypothetical protein